MSIIIPTLNEEDHLGDVVRRLRNGAHEHELEIIVADGGSVDSTREVASELGVKIVQCTEAHRALQMNEAAAVADGDILYFVHADSLPPMSYADELAKAIDEGADLGSFRFRFKSDNRLLHFNSWCTRLNLLSVRGGDQTLFMKREVFDQLQGYCWKHCIMEEYDFIRRSKQAGFKFRLIQNDVEVSARKYDENSWLRVNFANLVAMTMWRMGTSPSKIKQTYFTLLKHPKAS